MSINLVKRAQQVTRHTYTHTDRLTLEAPIHDNRCGNILSLHFFPQAVRRTMDLKTVDVYNLLNEELNAVKKELTAKAVPQHPSHPKFSGAAHWARSLKRRIERSMMVR